MTPGFQSQIAYVVTSDGRNVKLVEAIKCVAKDGRIFVLPRGANSDGISLPAVLRPIYDKIKIRSSGSIMFGNSCWLSHVINTT